jgi:hypothetical protein
MKRNNMMLRQFASFSWYVGMLVALLLLGNSPVNADEKVPTTAVGTGVYCPTTGYMFGSGDGTPFGKSIYSGYIETDDPDPSTPLTLTFQNAGRGTKNEILQETIAEDGSTLSFRFHGDVEIIPLDALGNFTALWEGEWEIVRGTGRMRNAKGTLDVVAVNNPFTFEDPHWSFGWSWSGIMKIKSNATKHYIRLHADGSGVFDPANLGVGDPASLPFPIIIGDGSGAGVYDGTPTGSNFRMDGKLVGTGFDQHFGTAQSITTGIPFGNSVLYPGVSGDNPDGSGRPIHIMRTDAGELWFEYTYFFELDPFFGDNGAIIGRADFRVVGGTGQYKRASGSVYVRVESDLGGVTGLPDNPVAPFDYEFDGFIQLHGSRKK